MDYKKAYEDALERAKGIYNENPSSSTAKFVCGQIFPEIKESEDERIRKRIISYLKQDIEEYPKRKERIEEMLTYLEKLKEKQPAGWKPEPESLEALMYAIEGKWEMIKPTSYLSRRLEDLYEGLVNTFNVDESLVVETEQKPAETSNIDLDTKVNDWVGYMLNDNAQSYSRKNVQILLDNCARFFYDYAVMCLDKPAEWSEEEERHLYNAIEAVKYVYDISEGTNGFKCVEFLKSLRPQPHWKPSEEQMEWLESAVKLSTDKPHIHGIIISLYEQLKRL